MTRRRYDIQGRIAHILPYDFRMPTLRKVRRLYDKGGPMFVPKVFGAGWDLNFAHPWAQRLLLLLSLGAAICVALT